MGINSILSKLVINFNQASFSPCIGHVMAPEEALETSLGRLCLKIFKSRIFRW